MPGDDWQAFANLRTLLGYQWCFPGKKLLFMGCEFGQRGEWNTNAALDWWLLDQGPFHRGLQQFIADLNLLYQAEPALWDGDYAVEGFSGWTAPTTRTASCPSSARTGPAPNISSSF